MNVWRRQCGVKCEGGFAYFRTLSKARRTFALLGAVPPVEQSTHGGTSTHPRLSVLVFRTSRGARSARAS